MRHAKYSRERASRILLPLLPAVGWEPPPLKPIGPAGCPSVLLLACQLSDSRGAGAAHARQQTHSAGEGRGRPGAQNDWQHPAAVAHCGRQRKATRHSTIGLHGAPKPDCSVALAMAGPCCFQRCGAACSPDRMGSSTAMCTSPASSMPPLSMRAARDPRAPLSQASCTNRRCWAVSHSLFELGLAPPPCRESRQLSQGGKVPPATAAVASHPAPQSKPCCG